MTEILKESRECFSRANICNQSKLLQDTMGSTLSTPGECIAKLFLAVINSVVL
jgi:hypothetical protein